MTEELKIAQECLTCRYFQSNEPFQHEAVCVFNAPIAVAVVRDGYTDVNGYFPPRYGWQFCGQWKERQ